jgi:hypothetical protein
LITIATEYVSIFTAGFLIGYWVGLMANGWEH